MSINTIIPEHIEIFRSIISHLPQTFDTHCFIKRFMKEFQIEYVRLLIQYDQDPFEKVHNQIGRILLNKKTSLSIRPNGKEKSDNIFGIQTENENWEKI